MFFGYIDPATLPPNRIKRLCGVYFLFSDSQLVYIGMSIDILSRVQQHAVNFKFDVFTYLECSRKEAVRLEAQYIYNLRPKLNIAVHKPKEKKPRPIKPKKPKSILVPSLFEGVFKDLSRKKFKWLAKDGRVRIGYFGHEKEALRAIINKRKSGRG